MKSDYLYDKKNKVCTTVFTEIMDQKLISDDLDITLGLTPGLGSRSG